MKLKLFFALFIIGLTSAFAQTKVSGYVYDVNDEPIPFANVVFKGSTEGTITNEDGRFYLESDETWNALILCSSSPNTKSSLTYAESPNPICI